MQGSVKIDFKNNEGECSLNLPTFISRDRLLSWSVVITVMKFPSEYLSND
jgi:hypothetical protein